MKQIDLNADLGESFGNYKIGNDKEIIPLISSANLACGFHAGDPDVIIASLEEIKKSKKTGLGAHPGFPDLMGFGRRYMDMTMAQVRAMLLYQISALDGMARVYGLKLNHVKPHGALYNATFNNKDLAITIAETVKQYNPKLKLMGISGGNLVKAGKSIGLKVVNEVFADRAYNDDGTLVSRRIKGAVITDPSQAVDHILRMVLDKKVKTINGKFIDIEADSICVHGDGEEALVFVQKIRQELAKNKIEIQTI